MLSGGGRTVMRERSDMFLELLLEAIDQMVDSAHLSEAHSLER
jgi:hypothetical protein